MEVPMASQKSIWVLMRLFVYVFVILSALTWKAWAADDIPPYCSLFTQQEVTELMGKAVQPGEETPLGCAWTPEGEMLSYLTVFIKIESQTAKTAIGARQGDFEVIDVSGVGDDTVAVIRKSSQRVLDMYVHKGKYLVRFNMPFLKITPSSNKFENFKKAAQKAVNRL
jgi:hypothetical protein